MCRSPLHPKAYLRHHRQRHADRQWQPGELPASGDETECCVCTEGRKTHIFMPCRHMCVCAGCAPEIMYWGWALLGVLDGLGKGEEHRVQ